MTTTEVDLQFLQRQQQKLLDEMALVRQESQATRAEARQVRGGFTGIGEQLLRLDRRISEIREDFETVLKLELGGTIANLETRTEIRFDAIDRRFNATDARFDAIEARLGGLEAGMAAILEELKQARSDR